MERVPTNEQAAAPGTVAGAIAVHRAAGTHFEAAGVRSFVRAQGDGDPIVLTHGLPSSSFLYRKVIPELAAAGFRALSFDLPGLGLADRPCYPGGYTPTSDRKGVPCYFDDHPSAAGTDLTGDEYVASAQNIGAGAPQGVNCSVSELVGGQCLQSLKSQIEATGGSYDASG